MAESARNQPQIVPVPAEHWAEALDCVFAHLPDDDRRQQVAAALEDAADDRQRPAGLFGAYRGGRLVGAGFSQIQPGKTANLFLPRLVAGETPSTADRLLQATCDWLAKQEICLAQVLLHRPSQRELELLQQWGFEHLADLLYLVSLDDQFPRSLPPTALQFEPCCESNHRRLSQVVEATYGQTRDCPRLNGVRPIEDVLAGYRAAGGFDPRLWLIVRHEGCDVGCLLLADHPQHGNCELVYMGVAAAARGRGWGTDITRHAQYLARQIGRTRLVLAVDATNEPAIRVYAAAGFRPWQQRSVYAKFFLAGG